MKKKRSYALRVVCIAIIALVGMGSFFQWQFFSRDCSSINERVPEVFTGVLQNVPERKNGKWVVDISSPTFGDSSWCRVRVYSEEDLSQFRFHDVCTVYGETVLPESFDGFSYPEYLKAHGVHFLIFQGSVSRDNSEERSSSLQALLLDVRSWLTSRMYGVLPSPHADILLALMLGVRSGIPEDIRESFSNVGASHILAVSGLHMTLLATYCTSFLLAIGFSRKRVHYIVSLFIIVYILLIGAPASAVRAGSMSILLILPRVLGRLGNGINALCVVAAVMACINPYIVLYDVSYQLSVTATFGIMVFGKQVEHVLELIHIPKKLGVRSSIAMTCAASLTTWPLLLFHFRQFSFLSVVSTILLVPLLPFLFLFGSIGFFCGQACSLPLWGMVEYMIRITEWLEQFDFFIFSL